MSNPGNSGHRGYKMSKVTAIGTKGNQVAITLDCGHLYIFDPYHGYTAEEWAAHIQQGERPYEIGKTRLRCQKKH